MKKISLDDSPLSDIDPTEIGSITSRYRNERIVHFPTELSEDSTSVWISTVKLQEFLDANPGATGVRLYYGVVNDPYAIAGIHNLVLVPTKNGKEDQISADDAVLITENTFQLPAQGTLNVVICPPPLDRCNGRVF